MQTTSLAADVRCLYGLPDHERYQELKGWLEEDENRFLLILEEKTGGLCSRHERMLICNPYDEEGLKKQLWNLVFLRFEYLDVPGNSSKDYKKMKEVFACVAHFQEGIHLTASDFQQRGINLLENYLHHYARFSAIRDGRELFGRFKNIPAVICGAGLSLEKQAAGLCALKEQAIFFAGGTALSSLSALGITPHFGGYIDPQPPAARIFENTAFEIPIFFQSRAHPLSLKQMQGPQLWIPGSGNDLLEQGEFNGGWNVATFLTSIAYELGCNPIILVGIDLCREKRKSYSGGFERDEDDELIPLVDGRYTQRDWLFAADWFAEFGAAHKEVEWINTSKGIKMSGFRDCSIDEISLREQKDLCGMVHGKVEQINEGIQVPVDPVDMIKSFVEVEALCDEMLAIFEKVFPDPPEKSGEYLFLKDEIEKQRAYTQFLVPVWNIWKFVLSRQIPKEIPEAYGIGLNQWLFMKGICDDIRKI